MTRNRTHTPMIQPLELKCAAVDRLAMAHHKIKQKSKVADNHLKITSIVQFGEQRQIYYSGI